MHACVRLHIYIAPLYRTLAHKHPDTYLCLFLFFVSCSSLSSGLNALSAVTFSDILVAFNCFRSTSDAKSSMIAKLTGMNL
jgi:hypothetical protein